MTLASGLCFTFLAVGSNPDWGDVFFKNYIKILKRFSFNQNDYFGTITPIKLFICKSCFQINFKSISSSTKFLNIEIRNSQP